MVGITSLGAYIPIYRLNRNEIARIWGTKSLGGEKAVAGYDEDSLTMAVAAANNAIETEIDEIDGLFFATTTAPYKEKQSAAVIASAIDLDRRCYTSDLCNSLRTGTLAIRSAIDTVNSGSAGNIMVIASDCRMGAAQGRFEQLLGDGAAALIIGSKDPIALIEGTYSIFSEFTDIWRGQLDYFIRFVENRYATDVGYKPIMQEVISEIMKKYKLTPKDFSKIVFDGLEIKEHHRIAKKLGFEESQIIKPLSKDVGHTGSASSILMLISCLEEASPGDRVLFASYGDGSDAFIFRITEHIEKIKKGTLRESLSKKIPIDYGKYLTWRNLVPEEVSTLPERPTLSLARRWRERKSILALYGYKCKQCGTPQFSPLGQTSRVCVVCQAKDNFEEYKFSDKKGKIFTYSVDSLQATRNPPGLNGVVDFDGGGRLICEVTDCEPDKIHVGMSVEMTFRMMFQSKGINNYFWKAKPII
ncbi:MAG: hydroxymethylglutaryl-CoA synthase [Deltaproteobacteria bacterium]|nr:hydroxymethylglutaryl-CoA synthase [Deltaproteobacteria bacterium]